ncbi:hypothetical protein K3495_g9687 [Podosphaera aphanis]|nr:hypothetical protein K3495_g9687 [Podosphaera aphanis]
MWIPSPTAAHKATGMVEKCIHIMEMVLKKSSKSVHLWPFLCQTVAHEVNCCHIQHLGFSPFKIDGGYQPPSAVEYVAPSPKRAAKKKAMNTSHYPMALVKRKEEQECAVFEFVAERERRWDEVRNAFSWAK